MSILKKAPVVRALAGIASATIALGAHASIAFADPMGSLGGLKNPLNVSSLPCLIAKILQGVVTIGIPVAAVFIIYAGFLFVSARGNETQLATAKRAFIGAIIGTAILVGAQVISNVIATTISSLGATSSETTTCN